MQGNHDALAAHQDPLGSQNHALFSQAGMKLTQHTPMLPCPNRYISSRCRCSAWAKKRLAANAQPPPPPQQRTAAALIRGLNSFGGWASMAATMACRAATAFSWPAGAWTCQLRTAFQQFRSLNEGRLQALTTKSPKPYAWPRKQHYKCMIPGCSCVAQEHSQAACRLRKMTDATCASSKQASPWMPHSWVPQCGPRQIYPACRITSSK
jgi:hypothetical protein